MISIPRLYLRENPTAFSSYGPKFSGEMNALAAIMIYCEPSATFHICVSK